MSDNVTPVTPAAVDSKSSVELSMNAKGKIQVTVKSRHEDIVKAAEDAAAALKKAMESTKALNLSLASDI